MKKILLIASAFLFAFGVAHLPAAEARGFVGVGVGCCGGYYPYPYPAYYYPYAVAPPPVVYAVPPPSPVVYAAPPPPPGYYAPMPASAPPAASPTYIDSQGRTCRQLQSSSGSPAGIACLQPDGTWHTVQ